MQFYNSVGPNPRIVRMFAAERGITMPSVQVDLRGGENRQPAYLAKNPLGQMPALELDDGFVLTEVTAICEYLDDTATSGASLFGNTPLERAETHMWTRRIDLYIAEPLMAGFRYAEGLKMFQSRMRCMPQAADDFKANARDKLAWLDSQMVGREFVCGARLTMADILLFGMVDFAGQVGQPLDPGWQQLTAWMARMKSRPSAAA